MARYLMTHSLMSSWLYAMKENPFEDMTTERDPLAEFVATLNKVPTPPNEAMSNGIAFEDLVTAITQGAGIRKTAGMTPPPRWPRLSAAVSCSTGPARLSRSAV